MPPEHIVILPMDNLSSRIDEISRSIGRVAELAVGILRSEGSMIINDLVSCLMSEPYGVSFQDVSDTISSMVQARLLEIDCIVVSPSKDFTLDLLARLTTRRFS